MLRRPSRRAWSLSGLGLLLGLVLAYGWLLYKHVEAVSYFRDTPAGWQKTRQLTCIHWRDKYYFGDLRKGSADPFKPLELSCQQALKLPAQSAFALNQRGQKIHYLRYPSVKNPQSPILLYVHGIAANYVNGLKLYPMAQRLGFELVILELSNHGSSDDNGLGAAYGCREQADLLAVIQSLVKQHPRRPMLLFGTSMGAMTIADAAPELEAYRAQIKAVVLENPQSSLRDILGVYAQKMHLPDFHTDLVVELTGRRAGYDFKECAPIRRLNQLRIPTWVTISEKDFMVPVWMAKKVYQHLPTDLPNLYTQYPEGEHGAVWNGQPQEFEADLRDFWQQSLAYPAQAASRQPGS